jgi:hydroxyacylglutathione hydrolase
LFDSLRNKIMPLGDQIIVYPAHGAGSACGKNMAKETSDTLGHQKQYNYALRSDMTKEEFIKEVTEGLTPPPAYFPMNVKMNKEGYENFEQVLKQGTQPLSVEAFEAAANETGALMLDTRAPEVFAQGFIPNSVNIGIDGSFAPWVGALVSDIHQPILIIAEEGREEEVVTRLARVGYDASIGYLQGGIKAWKQAGKELDEIESISAAELAARLEKDPALHIADVRRESEFVSEHIVGAENMPLDYINDQVAKLDKNKTWYVHCAGGYRSMVFNSILRARGFDKLINVEGGIKAVKDTGRVAVSDYVNPTTML